MTRIIIALIILVLGTALGLGGIWLTVLGGSWGFVILAVPLLLSAVLLLRRRRSGLAVYALAIALTLVWALWEVGFDWWALAPREGLIVVLGMLLLLPPVARNLTPHAGQPGRYSVASASLAAVLAVAAAIAGVALFSHPHELEGDLPAKRMPAESAAQGSKEAGEWRAYGRTAAGQRFSPLAQITAKNVGQLQKVWEYHAGNIHPDLPGSAFESTPLIVDDTLFVCTPRSEVIALDPVTGTQRWRFDPELIALPRGLAHYTTCRGLSYDDTGPTGDAPMATAEEAKALVAASRAAATRAAAGVAQNIVVGTAKPDAPNPVVTAPSTDVDLAVRRDCHDVFSWPPETPG